ncbi:MAG: SDR family oxidoreductase [Bdellovibrionota bacterium]|nr:SDR family oxidoreductase [Bdellovibrionota bacterium]
MNVFITGVNRGLGLSLSQVFLERKMTVYGTVRNLHSDNMDGIKNLKKEYHQKLHLIKLDVTQKNLQEQIIQHIPKDLELDILITNSGIYNKNTSAGLEKHTMEDTFEALMVNTLGPMKVTQTLLPNLQRSKDPKVVNITSILGSIALNKNFSSTYDYRVSKAGLNMFSKNLALEFPEIIVLNLHPGWVKTRMGGDEAPLTPERSAQKMVSIILEADLGLSSAYLDQEKEIIPW